MGVPKFYRWLSERYPCVNQPIGDSTLLPGFDNLYLDMNGIIHNSTHGNGGMNKVKSEHEVVLLMIAYIDRIVKIVKPCKVLYLAIDGVAPRAKMNQQRSRRFRAARDMAEAKAAARRAGEIVNDDEVFDSNCITPGTEFMAKVSLHLKYFIRKKIREDVVWQRLEVIFSGHEVPGEGEHKIIDFIRNLKSKPDYCPNTRHCMAGLDADLIMLALATHEPNFALLREQIDFGAFKRKDSDKAVAKTQDTKWQVLQIGLLREYLEMDMKPTIPVPFGFDGERVVDDFVLLTVLCGNDFIPHLPSLDIGEGALDLILQYYREHLSYLGGYLVEEGMIRFDRLEALTAFMGTLEESVLAKREAEMERFARRHGGRVEEDVDMYESSDLDLLSGVESESGTGSGAGSGAEDESDREVREAAVMLSTLSTKDYKSKYYIEKFGTIGADSTLRTQVVQSYVEALQWVMLYYTYGVPSWGWFYPFHYAPMTSDLAGMTRFRVEFVKGAPFLPFQQLLGCLPAASAKFLPSCYRFLMTSPESPIAASFPDVESIKIDMNGKKNPWEGVALIPFIDESVMLKAITDYCPETALTPDEVLRNKFGHEWRFTFAPECSDPLESTLPGVFPTITRSMSRQEPYHPSTVSLFVLKPLKGAVYPAPGFPTLYSTFVGGHREKIGVNVFGVGASKKETLVLYVANGRVNIRTGEKLPAHYPTFSIDYAPGTGPHLSLDTKAETDPLLMSLLPLADLAAMFIGKVATVNWPHLREGKVVGVYDAEGEFQLKPNGTVTRKEHSDVEKAHFYGVADGIRNELLTGGGKLRSAGVRIADVNQLMNVRLLTGMRRDPKTGALLREFAEAGTEGDIVVPAQLVFQTNPIPDPRFIEQPALAPEERLLIGSSAVVTAGPKAGSLCVIQGYTPDHNAIIEVPDRPKEPPFGYTIAGSISDTYYDLNAIATALRCRAGVVAFLTGSVYVDYGDRQRADIGLRFRANKDTLYLEGYLQPLLPETQTVQAAWKTGDSVSAITNTTQVKIRFNYSETAMHILSAYKRQFPRVFDMIQDQFDTAGGGRFKFTMEALGGPEELQKIRKWLSQLDCATLPLVPINTRTMPRLGIRAVEMASERLLQTTLKALAESPSVSTLEIPPQYLYKRESEGYDQADASGSIVFGVQLPLPNLGDRVVNLGHMQAPVGLRGTVVTIYPATGYVCVVFDEEFTGGASIEKACVKRCAAVVRWEHLLPLYAVGCESVTALNPTASSVINGPVGKVTGQSAKALQLGFTPLLGTKPTTGSATLVRSQTTAVVITKAQQQQQQQQQQATPLTRAATTTTTTTTSTGKSDAVPFVDPAILSVSHEPPPTIVLASSGSIKHGHSHAHSKSQPHSRPTSGTSPQVKPTTTTPIVAPPPIPVDVKLASQQSPIVKVSSQLNTTSTVTVTATVTSTTTAATTTTTTTPATRPNFQAVMSVLSGQSSVLPKK